jgi:hypothetical protein
MSHATFSRECHLIYILSQTKSLYIFTSYFSYSLILSSHICLDLFSTHIFLFRGHITRLFTVSQLSFLRASLRALPSHHISIHLPFYILLTSYAKPFSLILRLCSNVFRSFYFYFVLVLSCSETSLHSESVKLKAAAVCVWMCQWLKEVWGYTGHTLCLLFISFSTVASPAPCMRDVVMGEGGNDKEIDG